VWVEQTWHRLAIWHPFPVNDAPRSLIDDLIHHRQELLVVLDLLREDRCESPGPPHETPCGAQSHVDLKTKPDDGMRKTKTNYIPLYTHLHGLPTTPTSFATQSRSSLTASRTRASNSAASASQFLVPTITVAGETG